MPHFKNYQVEIHFNIIYRIDYMFKYFGPLISSAVNLENSLGCMDGWLAILGPFLQYSSHIRTI